MYRISSMTGVDPFVPFVFVLISFPLLCISANSLIGFIFIIKDINWSWTEIYGKDIRVHVSIFGRCVPGTLSYRMRLFRLIGKTQDMGEDKVNLTNSTLMIPYSRKSWQQQFIVSRPNLVNV